MQLYVLLRVFTRIFTHQLVAGMNLWDLSSVKVYRIIGISGFALCEGNMRRWGTLLQRVLHVTLKRSRDNRNQLEASESV